MNRLSKDAENVTHIPPANHNSTASAASIHNDGASNGGGEDEWVLFHPEVAEKTGIAFATICYGIYLWIKTPATKIFTKPEIDRKVAAFQSLRQFEESYPWWDHSTISKAIGRGEEKLKGQLVVDRGRKPLHFAMADKLLKMHREKKGLLGYLKADAIKYGAWPAVLLANLRHQVNVFTNPVMDDDDNRYGELSPTKLTKKQADKNGDVRSILPIKYDRAVDVITALKKAGAIVPHPARTGFYRFPENGEIVGFCDCNTRKRNVGKVDTTVGKVDSVVGKVDTSDEVNIHKAPNSSVLQASFQSLDSNIDGNVDRKCLTVSTSSLRSNVNIDRSLLSPGAKKLIQLINEDLAKHKQDIFTSCTIFDYAVYSVTDYDASPRLLGYELPYDFLPVDECTGELYSRANEIDEAMNQLKMDFKLCQFSYTSKSISALRALFETHPLLTYEHISDLHHYTSPQTNELIIGNKRSPKPGIYDEWYWARRIRNLDCLMRYLPQLVREYYGEPIEAMGEDGTMAFLVGDDGMPVMDYSRIPSPFVEIVFPDGQTPSWDGQELTIPTTYWREGKYIITSYGDHGDWVTTKTRIACPYVYEKPYKEYRGVGDPEFNPISNTLHPDYGYGEDDIIEEETLEAMAA